MQYTVQQIAEILGAPFVGDGDIVVTALSEPGDAGPDALALASSPKYAKKIAKGAARAAILWADADWKALGLKAAIMPSRPRFALSNLTALMDPGPRFGVGIHPSASVDGSASVADGVSIGPGAVIGPDASIGSGSIIGPLSFVGRGSQLGQSAVLREHVSIGAGTRIGNRFVAQPGARVAGDGFSFVTTESGGVETVRETLGKEGVAVGQNWTRIHSLGGVEIGDDVELGANSVIDSGTIRPTRIGNRTKIDNLVHIGHNCVIGEDNLLCGLVGIAGSVTTGKFVILAGQVGVVDNITIGDRVVIGAGSKVLTSVPAGRVMLGYPATDMQTQIASYKAFRRLPRVLRDFAAFKKSIPKSDGSG